MVDHRWLGARGYPVDSPFPQRGLVIPTPLMGRDAWRALPSPRGGMAYPPLEKGGVWHTPTFSNQFA